MTLLRPLLELPAELNRVSFVQSLSRAVADPAATIAQYAITPDLLRNFEEALSAVKAALDGGRSQPIFLRGAFGSGKSHFMGVLYHLLAGAPEALGHPSLHPLTERARALHGRRLLQLHFHMLDKPSLEAAIFGGYVEHVRAHHPDAPLPALFRDAELFDNADTLRRSMGDEAFFGALNQGAGSSAAAAFGKRAAVTVWDRDRYATARASGEAATRAALFNALVRTLLPAFARQQDRWVDIDSGLGVLSRHAHSLGYGGVVLYLDELILWLMTLAASREFVQREINKLVKLAEAGDERRPAPIVSFIARQRDLREVVGDQGTGAERAIIDETLGHHRARFASIELSERNLRAIVPVKVVLPKSASDRAQLDEGFAQLWRKAKDARTALGGVEGTEADCRQVYPFSPALIEVLVALSDRLQRDRTAIRILVELLVEHLPDLELGQVVPVGDVFDLVVSADDAVDETSRRAFALARDLYRHELLPQLQKRNGTGDPSRCQRMREGHPLRLGCSGCRELTCRNENRLLKTVLLGALAPRVPVLEGLTVSRLVHLNHGAVTLPTAMMCVRTTAGKLRDVHREVRALEVSEGDDPRVSVSLHTVDLKPVLARAASRDSVEARKRALRKLLFDELGVDTRADGAVPHKLALHHIERPGLVRFCNVREASADELRCPSQVFWQVVVDYPFDDPGYGPKEDEDRLRALFDHGEAVCCVAWLPTFFAPATQEELGEYVRLQAILTEGDAGRYLVDLPMDKHGQARQELESLLTRRTASLKEALNKAYGLLRVSETDTQLDLNRRAPHHAIALWDQRELPLAKGADLAEALAALGEAALRFRFPAHPELGAPPRAPRVGKLRALLQPVMEGEGGVIELVPDDRALAAELAVPLRLVTLAGSRLQRSDSLFDRVSANLGQAKVESPTPADLHRALDPQGQQGLTDELLALISWLWAARVRRVPTLGSRPFEWPPNARLPDNLRFEAPDLPSEAAFTLATNRALTLNQKISSAVLNLRSLTDLDRAFERIKAEPRAAAARQIPALLASRTAALEGEAGPRDQTAAALAMWIAALDAPDPTARVEALAAAPDGTSATAVGAAFRSAVEVSRSLADHGWSTLELLGAHRAAGPVATRASDLWAEARALLKADELSSPLEAGLRELVTRAVLLLTQVHQLSTPPVAPPTPADLRAPPPQVPRQRPGLVIQGGPLGPVPAPAPGAEVSVDIPALYFGADEVDAVMGHLRMVLSEALAKGGSMSLRAVIRR